MVLLTREQIEARLVALHRASLELVSDLSLEVVLDRIAHLAREQAGARYAALGVLDEHGKLVHFIPVGMTSDEINQMAHPPDRSWIDRCHRQGKAAPYASLISHRICAAWVSLPTIRQ